MAEALLQALNAHVTAELSRRTSLIGPHRDDVLFSLGDEPLARFGSQGQQRTAVLAVKAAEYALLAHAVGEPPLLLLDDVLSELDAERRAAFLGSITDLEQAFITATEVPDFHGAHATLYRIQGGTIERPASAGRLHV
jgi:DNA replication and repair protein RecF